MADMFVLQTPKGELVKVKTKSGKVRMEIRWDDGFGPKMTKQIQGVQSYIDSEVLRLNDPYVPKETGILKQSGIMHTQIGTGEVKYRTPYARRWYYMPANFHEAPKRGNYWFEKMKREHKQRILEGAKHRVGEGI